jgi:hypothetical protein
VLRSLASDLGAITSALKAQDFNQFGISESHSRTLARPRQCFSIAERSLLAVTSDGASGVKAGSERANIVPSRPIKNFLKIPPNFSARPYMLVLVSRVFVKRKAEVALMNTLDIIRNVKSYLRLQNCLISGSRPGSPCPKSSAEASE